MSKYDWQHLVDNEEDITNGDMIAILWSVGDVYGRTRDLELSVDSEAAREVLNRLACSHDANYGITWETIDNVIQDVVKEEGERKVLDAAMVTTKKILKLQRNLGFHGEHPSVSRRDWREEVSHGDLQTGYWETVIRTLECDEAEAGSGQKSDQSD